MYLAGIDIGTTSICCVLADAERGGVVRTAARTNDSKISGSRPWEELQDPGRILTLVNQLLQECCGDEPGRIAAVGISCQMHGILYVDRNGHHASPLYTWQDLRGNVRFPEAGMSYAERLAELTGSRVFSGYGMVTHYYQTMNGLTPDAAVSLCSIGDYVAMRLCGLSEPVTDASNAASFGVFSLEDRDFDRCALEDAGLSAAILPRLSEHHRPLAGKMIMVSNPSTAVPVVCAIGDNQASFLGSVPHLARTLLYNIGTGAQISLFSDTPSVMRPLEARPFPGRGYLLVGASLGGGKTYALLEKFLQETCRAFSDFKERSLYEQMNRLAQEALDEGGDPPIIDTQFFGTRNDPEAAGTIRNLTHRNLTPGYMILGFLEGMINELQDFAERFPEEHKQAVNCAAAAGNGLRKNPVLRRLLKSRLHVPLFLSDVREEAAYGAAIHGGVGSGWFPDYESALTIMQRSGKHED